MNESGDRALRERFTLGVEEEYQLVHPETGELGSYGALVRRADRSGAVIGEIQDTMLEVGTPVCLDTVELAASIRERRFQASAAAASEEMEILAAGAHPFSGWQNQVLTDASRPRMLMRHFRQLLRQQSICGMHVHVAVPPDLDRVLLMNTVRTFGPHLLALSCSSPLHLGTDTGFASFRTVFWRGFPFVGAPPEFASIAEYREYVELLLRAGTIPDERTLYWSVRPSPRYPTLELRVCDSCPRIGDAVAIAALARAIVVGTAEGALQPLGASLSASLQGEVLRENEWLAARDGLDAILIDPEREGSRIPVREAIGDLLESVAPIAQRLGDADALAAVATILDHGNAADRMRDHLARGATVQSLVDWLVQETRASTGIDRRTRGRDEPGNEALSTSTL